MKSLSLLSSSIAIGMSLYTCKCWILDCARPKFNRVVFLTIKSSQEYVNMSSPTLYESSLALAGERCLIQLEVTVLFYRRCLTYL